MEKFPKYKYYPGLDALRGVAVISVVLFHYFPNALSLSFGWMGVDLFFVISGFLITSILLYSKESEVYFTSFYARRVLRIMPAYFFLLGIFFSIAIFFDKSNQLLFYKHNWWWYFLFLENWLFILKGMPGEYFLNHLWSLAVEEQFYLIFPLLVKSFSAKQLGRVILCLFPIICIVRSFLYLRYSNVIPLYYCNTLTRIDSVLLGCLLGCGYRFKKTSKTVATLAGSLTILLACAFRYRSLYLNNPAFATFGYTILAVFFYCCLSIYTSRPDTFHFFRYNPFLNYVGKISYGVYLFHIPIYLLTVAVFSKWWTSWSNSITIGSVSIIGTLTVATISFFVLEKYFLRLKSFFPVMLKRNSIQP